MSKRQELVEFKCYCFFPKVMMLFLTNSKPPFKVTSQKSQAFFFFSSGKHHIQFFALNFLLQRRAKVNMATVVLSSMKDVIFLSLCLISGTCLLLLAKTSKLLKLLDNMDGSRS